MTSLNHNLLFYEAGFKKTLWSSHCVKSVQIQSFFWSVFCIWVEYGNQENTDQKKTSYLDIFYAVSVLITTPLCYLALRMNFKQISYLATLLIKIANKNHWESLLITNLTSPRILLAIPKRRMQTSITLAEYKKI